MNRARLGYHWLQIKAGSNHSMRGHEQKKLTPAILSFSQTCEDNGLRTSSFEGSKDPDLANESDWSWDLHARTFGDTQITLSFTKGASSECSVDPYTVGIALENRT